MAQILYITPHPDDECLSMGMSIANHIWYGHYVHVALMTKGSSSGAKDTINGTNYCDWHNKYHVPSEEGYDNLSVDAFCNGRVEEFKYSLACLGVKPDNVIVYDYEDGMLAKDAVKTAIKKFLLDHPDCFIKTTSYHDIHPDHRACGEALLELYNSGHVSDARFYVSPVQWDDTAGYFESNGECSIFVEASLSVYKRWNPAYSIYGIGYHSVPSIFDISSVGLKCKYHNPGE